MRSLIEKAINEFNSLDNEPLLLVSHLDCDGITAASIMISALNRKDKKFVLRIVKQLNENVLKELSLEKHKTILFTDLGSGYTNLINKFLNDKKIFIFDHHLPDEVKDYKNIVHVNPHLSKEKENLLNLSGSGITYLFAKSLDKNNINLAHLAVIGTIGDMQGFHSVNKEILDDAVNQGKITIKRGLKMFGSQTRPLNKLLQYSTDPYIPGVTGSEEGTFDFLTQSGINYIENGKIKKIVDLSDEDLKKLTTAIILRRLGSEKKPEDIFGDVYILNEETEDVLKDAREFSTLLNCCGRLNKPSIGIGVCLGNQIFKEKAKELLKQYKLELINGLNWFYSSKDKLLHGDNFIIVNAESKIRDTLIGTLMSIISRSNVYKDGTVLIGMAYTIDNKIKLSMRSCNYSNYNLIELLVKIVNGYGEAGGHKEACGGSIPIENEQEFINKAKEILSKIE